MEVCTEFLSDAAINGTVRTDIGTLSPAVVSTLTCPTDMGWGDEYSAPKGAMATFSVLSGLNFSLAAVSAVINERCEPLLKRMFSCIRIPSPITGAIAVFSKVTVVRGISLLLCTPCSTGAALAFTCCAGCLLGGCAGVSVSCLLGLGVSLSVGLHKLVWCLCLQCLHRNLWDFVVPETVET